VDSVLSLHAALLSVGCGETLSLTALAMKTIDSTVKMYA
jgi:hypothetical protein